MAQEKEVICKVYENQQTGQKLVTIPQRARSISPGDFVKIVKVKVVEF